MLQLSLQLVKLKYFAKSNSASLFFRIPCKRKYGFPPILTMVQIKTICCPCVIEIGFAQSNLHYLRIPSDCMRSVWGVYEECMKSVWRVYEESMRRVWGEYEKSMRRVWGEYEESMRRVWGEYEESMGKPWERYRKGIWKVWPFLKSLDTFRG